MNGMVSEVSQEGPFFEVGGDGISPDDLDTDLAKSLFDFVQNHGGHAATVEELRRIDRRIEVIVLNLTTCISQEPKYEVLPEERLAVAFINDEPAVVPKSLVGPSPGSDVLTPAMWMMLSSYHTQFFCRPNRQL